MAKAKILLVEDSEAQAGVAKEFLEKNSYEVIWAEDGKSAIKFAKTEPIDIILLDLVLPR
jgi:DNA-binding response OmpR family regulator